MSKDPKSPSRAPASGKRQIPPGASWSAENARIDDPAPGEDTPEKLGQEAPQTAAARPNTVTDEELPNASVLDEGEKPEGHVEMPAAKEDPPPPADASTP